MISREFLSWLESNWPRTLVMVCIVVVITFSLVVGMGLHFRTTDLAEKQAVHIEKIEDAATTAKEEAIKTRQELKNLETIIQGRQW